MESKPNLKFSKALRLLRSQDYGQVLKGPCLRNASGPYLLLAKRNRLLVARLGLIVPKKRLKRAVDRNSMKRRVREVFRHNQYRLAGYDLVFMLRGSCSDNTPQDIFRSIGQIFSRIIPDIQTIG